MIRRGLTLLEMTLAIGITGVIGAAIASMMAAASNSLTSKDDGRQSAIRLATTQVRLGAYIAPSLCLLAKDNSSFTLWFDDGIESKTVHASEIRWIQFNEVAKELSVMFVQFPEDWSQGSIDEANIECNELTDYSILLDTFQANSLIESIPLVDSMQTCQFWIETNNPIEAKRISIRFTLESSIGQTSDAYIDETIRLHQSPSEQQ